MSSSILFLVGTKMKTFSTKQSKMKVFITLSLYLFMILGMPIIEYICISETCQVPEIQIMQGYCENIIDNSSTDDKFKGKTFFSFKHNKCHCKNNFGFKCSTGVKIKPIISSEPQNKLSKLSVLYYKSKTINLIAKESTSFQHSPKLNSAQFSNRYVVLLI